MPLEGDWQLPGLARSLTLPIQRWPLNSLQRTPKNGRFVVSSGAGESRG